MDRSWSPNHRLVPLFACVIVHERLVGDLMECSPCMLTRVAQSASIQVFICNLVAIWLHSECATVCVCVCVCVCVLLRAF
jgi:hypothetical protein